MTVFLLTAELLATVHPTIVVVRTCHLLPRKREVQVASDLVRNAGLNVGVIPLGEAEVGSPLDRGIWLRPLQKSIQIAVLTTSSIGLALARLLLDVGVGAWEGAGVAREDVGVHVAVRHRGSCCLREVSKVI